MTVGMAAVWGAASAVAFKAIDTISQTLTDSLSGAIRRVDTLNNSGRTFSNMGFAADVTRSAINDLDKSIRGLPTPLDSAIRGMTSLAATYGDVSLGQKMFTSLNNAILGFGGTTEMVENAILQISQMPMDGPLDAQTWNSLRNSGLTPVLVAMGKEMGKSVSTMKEEFGDGTLKVQDFVSALIKMNKDGGGGLKSLEQIAKDSTAGINTGMANAQTAVERGIAAIIKAIGPQNISGVIAATGKAFEVGLTAIANGIIALPRVIDQFRKSVESMVNFVKANIVAFGAFAVAIGALTAPLAIAAASAAILDIRIRAMLAWSAVTKGVQALAVSFRVLGAAMAANPIGLIIASVGILVGVFALLWKNNEGFRNFFINAWSQIQTTFGTVSSAISNFVTTTWGGLLKIVGEVTTAVQNFVNAGLTMLNTALQATKQFLEDNRTTLTNIAIVITTLMLPMLTKMAIQFVVTAAQAVASAAQAAGAWIAGHARMAASSAISFAQMSVQFVQTAISSTIQAGIAAAAWIKNAALVSFAWVTQTLPSLIAGFVRSSAAAVVQAGIAAGAWIMQAGRVLLSWGATFVAYGIGVATAAAQTLLAGARMAAGWLLAMGPIGLIIAAVAGAVALIIANWDSVKGFVVGVWNTITQAVGNAINWVRNNWPLLLAILTGPVGLAVLWISRNVDQIKGFFSGAMDWIRNAFSGVGQIGKNIIDGLVGGLSPAPVINKMKEIAKGALDAVKNFLGIHSPSRVMRDQVGKMIGLGTAEGIAASTRAVVKSAQAQAASVLDAFSTMAGPNMGMSPQMAIAGAGAAGSAGQSFTIINPNPEETAAIVASRIKTQGGDI
jgi:tape measure domain-containing protein